MPPGAALNIAEIPYDTGEVRYRYLRIPSPDSKRWVRHGLFVEYLRDGTIVAEGHYESGKEEGAWKYFHPNGALAACGAYEKGAEHGLWHYWNPGGVEEPSVRFDRGKKRVPPKKPKKRAT